MKGMCLSQKTDKSVGRWKKRWSPTQSYTFESEHQHLVTQQFCHSCRMLPIFSCTHYNLDERVEKFRAKWGYKVHRAGWLGAVIIVWPHIMLQKSVLKPKREKKCRATILHIVPAPLPPPPAADPQPSLLPWPWSQPGGMMLQEARCSGGDRAIPWWQLPLHLRFDWLLPLCRAPPSAELAEPGRLLCCGSDWENWGARARPRPRWVLLWLAAASGVRGILGWLSNAGI